MTEEAIKLSIQDTDATDGKKKKKKIVKKKKDKEEKKEIKAPEITSGLRNMVSQTRTDFFSRQTTTKINISPNFDSWLYSLLYLIISYNCGQHLTGLRMI